MHFFLVTYKDHAALVDMVLRILKNLLLQDILKASDFQEQKLVEALLPLMTTRCRVSLIAKILSHLCSSAYFRELLSENSQILETILAQVTQNLLIISDECLENCLAALAAASRNSKENSLLIYRYPNSIKTIGSLMRHPERNVKIEVAKILTRVNKYQRLPSDY